MAARPQLVFGDDGSGAADIVWAWISAHTWPGWRVSVVTAEAMTFGGTGSGVRSSSRPRDPSENRRLMVGPEVTEVELSTTTGDPRIVLSSYEDASLVAVGPRGRGVLKQLHIGSTTEWLLHSPAAPLVIVRSPRPTRKVLLCVDGSTHARQAAHAVARLPWIDGCRVTILGVQGHDAQPEAGIAHAADLLGSAGAVLDERLVESIRFTATFDVRSVILEMIVDDVPDLVALGTRGMGWMRRTFIGSTATAVAHHAPCSILVTRDRTAAQAG